MNEHLTEGLHFVGTQRYLPDPCPEPSLSASTAFTLITRSPKHAFEGHPRLNPHYIRRHNQRFDIGSALHTKTLGDAAQFTIIEGDAYRTKEAKAARDAAYVQGKIPLLEAQWEQVQAVWKAGVTQLSLHDDKPFIQGKPEATLIWREGETWCRSLFDWMPDRPQPDETFFDYKTTSASANPDSVDRRLFSTGADIQAAFYLRGVRKVLGLTNPRFAFVVQETEPPYALCVVDFDAETMAVADRKVERALAMWGLCLSTNSWPAYPRHRCMIQAPPWATREWEGVEDREQMNKDTGRDSFATMMAWQAPA